MSEVSVPTPSTRQLEITSAVVIGLATVLGAVAALFSSLWSGESSLGAQKAVFQLSQANTQYLEALQKKSDLDFLDFKDDYLYLEMKKALQQKDGQEAEYLISKMSPEQAVVMNADKASDEDKALAAYDQMMADRRAGTDRLMTAAIAEGAKTQDLMGRSARANESGDRFTLAVVLYTIVLFFAGISNLFDSGTMRRLFVGISVVVLALTTGLVLLLPIPPLPI